LKPSKTIWVLSPTTLGILNKFLLIIFKIFSSRLL